MLKLPRLQTSIPITDGVGKPTLTFHQWWKIIVENIESILGRVDTVETVFASTPEASADVADFRIPVSLNDEVYYILLKKE